MEDDSEYGRLAESGGARVFLEALDTEEFRRYRTLSEAAARVGSALERNFILQAIVGLLGVLYIADASLAQAAADAVKVSLKVVHLGLPVVTAYLFVRTGYMLAHYLKIRVALNRIRDTVRDSPATSDGATSSRLPAADLALLMRTDFPVFRFIPLERRSQAGQAVGTSKTGLAWLWDRRQRVFPFLAMALGVSCTMSVFNMSDALALYFIYKLMTTWHVPAAGAILITVVLGLIILALYENLWNDMRGTIRHVNIVVGLNASIFVIGATYLFVLNPLP